jgi:acyl carrier protein
MSEISKITSEALAAVLENMDGGESIRLDSSTNVFDAVDSFGIVDLLLETEERIEAAFGRYVPLADETLFDAEKSPLKNWSVWNAYVEKCIAA